MADWLLRKKLSEARFNGLLQLPEESKHVNEDCSPQLRELQIGEHNRVRHLSQIYEEKSSKFNFKTNWWLDSNTPKNDRKQSHAEGSYGPKALWPPAPKPRMSLSLNDLTTLKKEKSTTISKIVDELLQKEDTYLQSLERGIDNYVKIIRRGRSSVPEKLRGQTFSVFGNIEAIYELHRSIVCPRLHICAGSVQKIAETISSLVQNDYFYCYIVYAINHKSAEQIISANQQFFENLCIKRNDYLGINSFIILPVQKLPRYKLFLEAIIREYNKSNPLDKDALAACCDAEKHVSNLLKRLNEAMLLNDIVETHELPAFEQLSMIASVKNQMGIRSGDEALMFIVPRQRSSSDYDFKSLLNIMDLGKFLKCSLFKIVELATKKSFTGKVFLFEKCLLYTRVISNHALSYRNHFKFGSNFAFLTREAPMLIRITDQMEKKQDILLSSDNIEVVAEMKKLINQFYDPRRSSDSAFVDSHELMINEEVLTDDDDDANILDHGDGWVLDAAEFASETANSTLNETIHIANSRFYIQSPENK